MKENTPEKHEEAFSEGSLERGYARDYLAEIRTNWREAENSISRSAVLIVAAVVIFELIFANGVSEADFAFIKLTRFGFVELALPVVVAYLYYSTVVTAVAAMLLTVTHNSVITKVYPVFSIIKYRMPLYPTNSLFYGAGDFAELISAGRSESHGLINFSTIIRGIVIFVGPLIFLVVAYTQLFIRYDIANPLLVVSLFVTAILVVAIFANFYVLSQISEKS